MGVWLLEILGVGEHERVMLEVGVIDTVRVGLGVHPPTVQLTVCEIEGVGVQPPAVQLTVCDGVGGGKLMLGLGVFVAVLVGVKLETGVRVGLTDNELVIVVLTVGVLL